MGGRTGFSVLRLYGNVGQLVKCIELKVASLSPGDVSRILRDTFPATIDERFDMVRKRVLAGTLSMGLTCSRW